MRQAEWRRIPVFTRQRLLGFEHRHLRAEPVKCLRKLEADRPGTDDNEMLRTHSEIEYRLVGEVRGILEPRDRRHRRRRTGRDHEAPGLDFEITADGHGAGIAEARGTFDHPHPQPGETLPRIVRRNGCDHVMDVPMNLGEIDIGMRRREPERPGLRDRMRPLARRPATPWTARSQY